jgi:hypothetical protein
MKTLTPCKLCGSPAHICYDHDYDAYYCARCEAWNENVCRDPDCCYCAHRPDKPDVQARVLEKHAGTFRRLSDE